MQIDIDTSGLERRFKRAPEKLKRISRNAMNDTARSLKKQVPDVIEEAVDNPRAFTKNSGRYKTASYGEMSASVYIEKTRADYLVHGEKGTPDKGVIVPGKAAKLDKYGNLRKLFTKRDERAKLLQQTVLIRRKKGSYRAKKYFVGKPNGHNASAPGIYERRKRGGIQRVATFRSRRSNSAKFNIIAKLHARGRPMLDKNIKKQMKHPANKL